MEPHAACPFCPPPEDRVFHRTGLVTAFWDVFPVSPGHALLIPNRHVPTWFDATAEEQAELLAAIEVARQAILERHRPDGFNIGVNVGEAAGQTVFHLHVHVIPRYAGDVPDPTGGVRHVIPAKANYRRGGGAGAGTPSFPSSSFPSSSLGTPISIPAASISAASIPASPISTPSPPPLLGRAPHDRTLVRGGDDPLLPHILGELDRAARVDMAVAFILCSGVRRIAEHLRDLLDRGGRARIVTGDYLDVTDPQALRELLDLDAGLDLRVYETTQTGFHPKAYLFYQSDGTGTAYVGSSNLTGPALETGVEWNYRVLWSDDSKDGRGFCDVADAFEQLYRHPSTRVVDAAWIAGYQARRRPMVRPAPVEIAPDAPDKPPEPHEIQLEALAALRATREAGNASGLVVLATGLGKTWLSAFDSVDAQFRRVLYVAHREEILAQAMKTFRRIRPQARLGRYTGEEKTLGADVLFASIQTLGRQAHLDRFRREEFDYIVVDEFHHAAAPTYRRLIAHFTPQFLLGLTATPERMDGGDLLGLCDENLVYRCDMLEGIRRERLCPFHYYGVPDEVDYANIPWRSGRFDEEELTRAVATTSRAQNALEQYRKRAGRRTLAFCCSQDHADFMADYFCRAGVLSAAVHAGKKSSPRATSLERLECGDLAVIFAVDMFNEGVDLPAIDTVMMLRPTESSTIWLQQFGRGLRRAEGKPHLTVIDYIGNHRMFLLKPRTLLGLLGQESTAWALTVAFRRIEAIQPALPPGCEVTYELAAIDILRALVPPPSRTDAIQAFYREFRDERGRRPTALEALHGGCNRRSLHKSFGSWFRFVKVMGDLSDDDQAVLGEAGEFLDVVEKTPMTKSFKMLVLQAMLDAGQLPGEMTIDALVSEFGRLASRSAVLREDVGPALDQPVELKRTDVVQPASDQRAELKRLVVTNPVDAWVGGRGTNGTKYFAFAGDRFCTTFSIGAGLKSRFQEMVEEIVAWRLAEYLQRPGTQQHGDASFVCRVIHSSGRPILKLPDRRRVLHIPLGWTDILVDGKQYRANFVKVAVNVVTVPGSSENVLTGILRGWFGPNAGQPGTQFGVTFEAAEGRHRMIPKHS